MIPSYAEAQGLVTCISLLGGRGYRIEKETRVHRKRIGSMDVRFWVNPCIPFPFPFFLFLLLSSLVLSCLSIFRAPSSPVVVVARGAALYVQCAAAAPEREKKEGNGKERKKIEMSIFLFWPF